jgi:hypothetical protein
MARKWLPLAPLGMPGIWWQLNNMVPTRAGSYYPGNLFATVVTPSLGAAADYVTRAWCALVNSDAVVGYVGTLTKLREYDGVSTFTDRSRGGNYTSTVRAWNFAQFGNITLASNRADAVQFRDATTGTAFADLTAAPKATILVTQSLCVLAFDINDGAEKRNAFAASAPADYTDWSGPGAMPATPILHRPGRITAAVAFQDYVLVFKRSSVYKVWYTGNIQYKWKVQLIATGRGAWGAFDVVNCGDSVIFSGPGGAWKYDGTNWTNITEFVGEIPEATSSVFCPLSQSVIFFTGDIGSAGEPTPGYTYNLVSQCWGRWTLYRSGGTYPSAYQDMWGCRIVMGEPAALRAFVTPTDALPDLVMSIPRDLSTGTSNGAVRKSSSYYGNGATSSSMYAYVTTGVEGIGGERLTRWGLVNMSYTCSITRTIDIAPSNTEMSCSIYSGNSIDDFALDAGSTLVETVTSETAQRRFQFTKATAPFGKLKFNIPADGGYTEILDCDPKTTDAGKYNPALP